MAIGPTCNGKEKVIYCSAMREKIAKFIGDLAEAIEIAFMIAFLPLTAYLIALSL